MAQVGPEHLEGDPLRVVIAAGGTAGHVVPAVAVADELRSRGAEVTFIGTRDRAEARIVPEAGFEIDYLDLRGIDRRNPLRAADAIAKAGLALPRATAILKERNASVVLGGGGYVAGPAGLAALGLGIPLVLTEADSHLGLTNRALAHRASTVCLSFPIEGRDHAPFVVTGRPLPPGFSERSREQARSRFGISSGETCVLVVGGSLGARSLNLSAPAALIPLGVDVIHISGHRDHDEVAELLAARGNPPGYKLLEYEPGLGEALAACDLVVGRAGGSVFEFCAAARPALLIPYPHATGDHQTQNARWMAEGGAARLLPDTELDSGTLRESVGEMLGQPELLASMAAASRSLARPDATRDVADAVVAAAKGQRFVPLPGSNAEAEAGTAVSGRSLDAGDFSGRKLHFIGIGGAGMSGLAAIAASRGAAVSGSDQADSSYLARVEALGIETFLGHDGAQVPADAEVIVSTAIADDNPELQAARSRGQKLRHRGELLAEISSGRRLVAIAGTHGKTTTTALCVHLLTSVGADPSFLIGGEIPGAGPDGTASNARWGSGEWMVTEADESDASFLELKPEIAVVTNIELDHHARWDSLADLREAFQAFVSPASALVQGPEVDLSLAGERLRYGIRNSSANPSGRRDFDIEAEDVAAIRGGEEFSVRGIPGLAADTSLRVPLPGQHNILNSLAALGACALTGALAESQPDEIRQALADFPGVARRFEAKGRTASGGLVFDDYAHHPTEVAAALDAAREVAEGRVIALFQPHLYSRTKALSREFGQALAAADEIGVLDVYPAREQPVGDLEGVSGRSVAVAAADAAHGKQVWWLPSREEALAALGPRVHEGDLLITLGAGDITLLAEDLASGGLQ